HIATSQCLKEVLGLQGRGIHGLAQAGLYTAEPCNGIIEYFNAGPEPECGPGCKFAYSPGTENNNIYGRNTAYVAEHEAIAVIGIGHQLCGDQYGSRTGDFAQGAYRGIITVFVAY